MTISYINDHFLRTWKSNNPLLGTLDVNQNHVIYNDNDLDMGDFNVQELMYDSSLFSAEVGAMDANKLFGILSTNVIAHKIAQQEDALDQFVIQSLSMASREDKDGISRTYVVCTDQNNTPHFISSSSPVIVLQAYSELITIKKEGTVTLKDLQEKITPSKSKQPENKTNNENVIKIPNLSWTSYYKMIHQEEALSEGQEQQLSEFNDFLLQLNKYDEYLTKDNADALNQYRYTMLGLQNKKDQNAANVNEGRAIGSYYEFMDRISLDNAKEQEFTNQKPMTMTLEKKAKTGKVSVAIILLLLSNVIIHVMFLLLLK